MPKKKQATKSEKQAVEKPPIDLSDEQLDIAQGGITTATQGGGTAATRAAEPSYTAIARDRPLEWIWHYPYYNIRLLAESCG